MPALSPTMSEGSVVKWHKKEGRLQKLLCNAPSLNSVRHLFYFSTFLILYLNVISLMAVIFHLFILISVELTQY